jgi:rare lipoprotein A
VRPLGAVAGVALIAALALVAIPLTVSSRTPNRDAAFDAQAFTRVGVSAAGIGTTAVTTRESAARSAGLLDPSRQLREPALPATWQAVPRTDVAPAARAVAVSISTWHWSAEESWYGPGFWGQGTACGLTLTLELKGVAHRSLPCGTLVQFKNPTTGQTVTVPVVDLGPYVAGRLWDLTKAACLVIDHCYTGSLWWRLAP